MTRAIKEEGLKFLAFPRMLSCIYNSLCADVKTVAWTVWSGGGEGGGEGERRGGENADCCKIPFRPFVTAHTFCASRDTREKKIGSLTIHFSEIIKLQFEGKKPYIALYFNIFYDNYCLILSQKMRGYPQFKISFLDFNSPLL